ncbi:MAG: hypothetical protein KKB25_01690 [Nanoarchaeota archaeon]|nr:hypothetical protein [Nanoarchaeota archaeon]
MRHTLKWSFFIGTAAAGIVLALMKLFQPISYGHLVVFGYAFVGTSLIAGYVAHKNLEKRILNKTQSVKTDGGKMEAQDITVKRIPINEKGMFCMQEKEIGNMQEKKAEEYFVPASRLQANANEFENKISDEQHHAAENFLEEIEKEEQEEIEKENIKIDNNAEFSEKTNHGLLQQNGLSKFKNSRAKILTSDGKTIAGKFAGMDTHVVLEDAECGAEKKSLLMISKSEIARMEIE